MIVDIISAIVNKQTDTLEIVKELTDDEGNSVYELHLIPIQALNGIAASHGVEDPDDAIDLVLYNPYVGITDDGDTHIDRVRKCKARLTDKNNKAQREAKRKNNLATAGVHERYHPIDGMDPIDVIKATAGVTTENIQKVKDRLKKEKPNEPQPTEQRPREEGRSGSRRAYISLGTDD